MSILSGFADAEQLAALTKLLEEYAQDVGIAGDKAGRERLATRIMKLFNNGVMTPEDIRRSWIPVPASG